MTKKMVFALACLPYHRRQDWFAVIDWRAGRRSHRCERHEYVPDLKSPRGLNRDDPERLQQFLPDYHHIVGRELRWQRRDSG